MSERHREALALLLYGVQCGGGFVLLTGEIGAGKTTVCRCFLEQLPEHCRVAYIFNPQLTVGDLLQTICHEFRLEVRHEGIGPATIKDHLDPLNEYLLRSHAAGQCNVLIIDEAQNLTPHVLEQLRLLTNLETSERKLLQIVLIGQPELRKELARPELEQLAQRVIARYHLGALDADETRRYVSHRMQVAGLQGPQPFSEESLKRVYEITRGVPRRINLLCDRALLGAYATEQRLISAALVDQAAREVFEPPEAPIGDTAVPGPARAPHPAWMLGLGALGGMVLTAAALAWWSQGASPLTILSPPSHASQGAQTVASAQSLAMTTDLEAAGAEPSGPVRALPLDRLPRPEELLDSEAAAWRALAPLWGQALGDGNPCALAMRNRLQCFTTDRMTLHGLRQLDRPGILLLQFPGEKPRQAMIVAMNAETATLEANAQRWLVPLTSLAHLWRGEYSTLWRQPEGSEGRITQHTRGPVREWLTRQFSTLQSRGAIPVQARSFDEQLAAFQASQGLETDGLAGAMTFMQVNLAVGVEEPRLHRH